MIFRIAIVDDLVEDRERLEAFVQQFFAAKSASDVSVSSFASAEELLSVFQPNSYDVAFLDICMDEMNGIELARELREKDAQLLIVFQTTAVEYAFDAFPLHPFDYLIKPCTAESMNNVLEEALRVLEAGDPTITVAAARASYQVPLRAIIAVTSQGHNTKLHLTNRQHLICSESFKGITAKIEDDARFLGINRGITINMDHVLAPDTDNMRMKDGTSYPIRVNGRPAVLTAFSQYMISKVSGDKGW